jgi:hypothetical protein
MLGFKAVMGWPWAGFDIINPWFCIGCIGKVQTIGKGGRFK